MTTSHREAAPGPSAAIALEPTTAPSPGSGAGDAAARAPLSCTRIIDAAVRYVDDNCLTELSMRRLGSELGVEAMSLYRYFPSKQALLDAVATWLLRDLALPDGAAANDWEPQVRAYAESFWTITQAHPNLMPLLATMSPNEPPLVDIHERMVGLWRRAGLDRSDAERAQRALQCYLSGSSQWHQTSCVGPHARDDFRFGLEVFLDGFRERVRPSR